MRPMAWLSDEMIDIAPRSCKMSSATMVSPRILDSAKATSSGMLLSRWWQTMSISKCSSIVFTVKGRVGFVEDGKTFGSPHVVDADCGAQQRQYEPVRHHICLSARVDHVVCVSRRAGQPECDMGPSVLRLLNRVRTARIDHVVCVFSSACGRAARDCACWPVLAEIVCEASVCIDARSRPACFLYFEPQRCLIAEITAFQQPQ